MSINNFAKNAYLDAAFTDGVIFSDIYIALSTTDPSLVLSEPGGNYARVRFSPNSITDGNWSASLNGEISNSRIIDFGTATGFWGFLTHFALMDAASGGNILHSITLAAAVSVNSNPVKFPAGSLQISAS